MAEGGYPPQSGQITGFEANGRLAGLGPLAAAAAALAGGRRRVGADKAQARSATTVESFENGLGVRAPTGFWDPAGFCNDGDES